jgi:co-chaperonin GroES (HSP10)
VRRRVGAGDREGRGGSYAGNEVVIEGEKYSAVRCIDLLSINSSFLH